LEDLSVYSGQILHPSDSTAMGYDRQLLLKLATSQGLEHRVKALPGGEAVAWRAASRYVAGVHVRVVKGAYVERTGAHPFGEPTDIAYLQLGGQLAAARANWSMATHDGRMREGLLLAEPTAVVEQLLGVRTDVLAELHDSGVKTRVYVPYGPDWFRYWARRIAESRGA
jgi:proline dehydrogenase